MGIYVEVNGIKYPASITGRMHDSEWDNRESKAITVDMSYEDAVALFIDDINWNIIQETEEIAEKIDEDGNVVLDANKNPIYETVIREECYDNSEYSIAGDIINHRNGKITVKMGKPTAEELLIMIEEALYGQN